MIIWNGKKLSQKKRQTQAAVKARVCADGSFWLGASRVNNLRYKHTYIYMYNIYIYIYIYIYVCMYVYKTLLRHLKKKQNKGKNGTPQKSVKGNKGKEKTISSFPFLEHKGSSVGLPFLNFILLYHNYYDY